MAACEAGRRSVIGVPSQRLPLQDPARPARAPVDERGVGRRWRRRRAARGRPRRVVMPPTPIERQVGADPAAQQPHHLERRVGQRRAGEPAGADAPRPAAGVEASPSREIVVLVAMIPSRPSSSARSATAARRRRRGRGRSSPAAARARRRPSSARRRTASSSGPSLSTACRSRRPGRVRRADVDHEVVGVRRQQPRRSSRSRRDRPVVLGHHLGLADVDAEHRPARPVGPSPAAARAGAATTSAPSLLKPIRLTTARSAGSRNSRGRAGCRAAARR